MNVYDFLNLACDDSYHVEICDLSQDADTVFSGEARDAMQSDFTDYEVLSFDLYLDGENVPTICLNIETEEED